jgi:hypothetical protein
VVKTRASLYMLAAARDGINEMHPEVLEKRMQVLYDGVPRAGPITLATHAHTLFEIEPSERF